MKAIRKLLIVVLLPIGLYLSGCTSTSTSMSGGGSYSTGGYVYYDYYPSSVWYPYYSMYWNCYWDPYWTYYSGSTWCGPYPAWNYSHRYPYYYGYKGDGRHDYHRRNYPSGDGRHDYHKPSNPPGERPGRDEHVARKEKSNPPQLNPKTRSQDASNLRIKGSASTPAPNPVAVRPSRTSQRPAVANRTPPTVSRPATSGQRQAPTATGSTKPAPPRSAPPPPPPSSSQSNSSYSSSQSSSVASSPSSSSASSSRSNSYRSSGGGGGERQATRSGRSIAKNEN